jgi:hypothetical protein
MAAKYCGVMSRRLARITSSAAVEPEGGTIRQIPPVKRIGRPEMYAALATPGTARTSCSTRS